jgi:2-phosphoglycerate kinase
MAEDVMNVPLYSMGESEATPVQNKEKVMQYGVTLPMKRDDEDGKMVQTDWTVLLLGGSSGVGKTTVAEQIGRHLGISWLQMDDFRLALQWSLASLLPEHPIEALNFFNNTTVWQLAPEHLCKGLITLGESMIPSLEIVVDNHVDTAAPTVIEGDGILPSLFARPSFQRHRTTGLVRAAFLVEPEEERLFANILERQRGTQNQSEAELRTEARTKWLYGQWLTEEAQQYGLPVLSPRPWSTLLERLLAAIAL